MLAFYDVEHSKVIEYLAKYLQNYDIYLRCWRKDHLLEKNQIHQRDTEPLALVTVVALTARIQAILKGITQGPLPSDAPDDYTSNDGLV